MLTARWTAVAVVAVLVVLASAPLGAAVGGSPPPTASSYSGNDHVTGANGAVGVDGIDPIRADSDDSDGDDSDGDDSDGDDNDSTDGGATDTVEDTVDDTTDDAEDTVDDTTDDAEDTADDAEEPTEETKENSAHAEIVADGTVVSRTVGNASASNRAAAVSVDFTVSNVSTGRTIPLTLPNQSVAGDENATGTTPNASMAVDRLDVTVTNDSDFTMNVTTADEPLNTTPDFEGVNGTEPLSHVRVNHSVSDADIENVTFTFRLSNERLDEMETSPTDVALYRYHDGEWTELPTRVRNVAADVVVFEAESPGLSEFAAGAKQPKFELNGAAVDVEKIDEGDTIDVFVTVTNLGGADGRFHADLILDDIVVADRDVTVASGGERKLTFERALDQAGEYEVRVNGVVAGVVTVEEAEVAKTRAATSESETSDGSVQAESAGIDGLSKLAGGLVVTLLLLVVARTRGRWD